MSDSASRRVALQRRLSFLALGAIVPLAVMAGVGLNALVSQQRLQAERASMDLTRALAVAVEAELRVTVSSLQTLASTSELNQGRTDTFEQAAEAVLRSRPEWRVILLARPDGSMVNSTNKGTWPLPPTIEMDSLQRAVQRREPVIGYLTRGPSGHWGIPVRVPIMVDGRASFILTGVLKPEALTALIQRQRVPAEWLVSIWDARALRVARSRKNDQFTGSGPSPSLGELFARGGQEGAGSTHTLEGEDVYTAFVKLSGSQWAVTVAVPETEMLRGARQSLMAYGGGVLASLIIGLMAAFAIARRINQPMGQLREAALALGSGIPVDVPEGDIQEIHDVAEALVAASRQRVASENERERLLIAERAAHAAAAAAMHEAQQANRTKDEFLAMLGHELRNPLSPIVTALHLMARRDPQGHAFERRIIERQVAHMTRLVDDLLDVSRITRGKIELRHERVDLRSVIERALEITRPLFDGRAHPVAVLMPGQAVHVWGDWVRLAQVVSNLLSNAAKFTPADGLVTVSLDCAGNSALITVTDTGSGMDADLLPKVFDLFVQGPQDIQRASGGLGLGLAIVKTLVELHGGSVTAASEGPGHGSTFKVVLPTMGALMSQGVIIDSAAATAQGCERVLIVDDNQDAAQTLALLLRDEGYEVRTAASAQEALALLDEFRPDLALLDIGLPGMDGYELAGVLHQRPDTRHTVTLALTGYGTEGDRTRALAAGFHGHLVKPVAMDALLRTIRDKLTEAASARQLNAAADRD